MRARRTDQARFLSYGANLLSNKVTKSLSLKLQMNGLATSNAELRAENAALVQQVGQLMGQQRDLVAENQLLRNENLSLKHALVCLLTYLLAKCKRDVRLCGKRLNGALQLF